MATKKKVSAADLGIDLRAMNEEEYFKWLLACLLFGKPIQQEVAVHAYREFVAAGLLSPEAIVNAGWNELVDILDRGHYVRFDYSTADKLIEVSLILIDQYEGKVTKLIESATDEKDLAARLDKLPGVGPTTVRIFMQGIGGGAGH
jgi:endonuclease III